MGPERWGPNLQDLPGKAGLTRCQDPQTPGTDSVAVWVRFLPNRRGQGRSTSIDLRGEGMKRRHTGTRSSYRSTSESKE